MSAASGAGAARAAADVGRWNLRGRFRQWWQARLPLTDTLTLTQRNVYILPTRPGFMLGATLLVLLVASINYQLNLGYLLTFLLAGSTVVGMHVCHGTLRGLTLHLVAPDKHFALATAVIEIKLISERRSPRHAIGMSVMGTGHWAWTDVPAQGSATVQVAFQPGQRGRHRVPALTAETRFPLGTFRVWTVWRPAAEVLVFPAPEPFPPPLPPGEPRSGGANAASVQATGEFDGVRAYRRGDPMKLVVWKKFARANELVSRDTQQAQRHELWLDFAQTGLPETEARLSRLCAWVLAADRLGVDYGLRLPAQEIRPACGSAHRLACLEALALC
jgi:uncharacterized protein (DUF58 family)